MLSVLTILLSAAALGGAFRDPIPVGDVNPRIVGGQDAALGAYPWQLSLEYATLGILWGHICGAVLIDEYTALTAAHCVDRGSTSSYRLHAGITDKRSTTNRQRIFISNIIQHPDWDTNGAGYPNDIAVLQLQSAANIGSEFITPVDLPEDDNDFSGQQCTLTGWGLKNGGDSSTPDWLQEVSMGVIPNSQCGSMWASVGGAEINDGHICIFEKGKSACSGDSGGPMVCNVGGTTYLAGITSWGISSCSGDYPSVYSRVTYFRDFINFYRS